MARRTLKGFLGSCGALRARGLHRPLGTGDRQQQWSGTWPFHGSKYRVLESNGRTDKKEAHSAAVEGGPILKKCLFTQAKWCHLPHSYIL